MGLSGVGDLGVWIALTNKICLDKLLGFNKDNLGPAWGQLSEHRQFRFLAILVTIISTETSPSPGVLGARQCLCWIRLLMTV